MNKRAELDTKNPPGQIVNPIPKQECEKLTFEQWYKNLYQGTFYERYVPKKHLLLCWYAAQENK